MVRISRATVIPLAAGLLSLSACGGGSGGGGALGPPAPEPPAATAKSFSEIKGDHVFLAPVAGFLGLFSQWGAIDEPVLFERATRMTTEFNAASNGMKLGFYGPGREAFEDQNRDLARSNDLFDIYVTSDAEFAVLKPLNAGLDYTSIMLVTDSKFIRSQGFFGPMAIGALAYGFNSTGSDLPQTGSALFRGAIAGSAVLSDGDFGGISGPAQINVDFVENQVTGQFGGQSSSQIPGSLRFTSMLDGRSGSIPDISFTAPLDRSNASFAGNAMFRVLDPRYMAIQGTVIGGLFGPSEGSGPPEVGGMLTIADEVIQLTAAFAASQGGTTTPWDFPGISTRIVDLRDIHRSYGSGVAPASLPAGFRDELEDVFLAGYANHPLPDAGLGKLTLDVRYDLALHYRPALSNAEVYTFEVPPTKLDGVGYRRSYLSIDSSDHDRFGMENVRYGNISHIDHTHEFSLRTAGDFEVEYFFMGKYLQPELLPITGVAKFEGAASGQFIFPHPLEDAATPTPPVFDFDSSVAIDLNFATGALSATFSGYDLPAELRAMVEPEARTKFTLETSFNSSLNRFGARVLGAQNMLEGHVSDSSMGHQIAGAFRHTFPLLNLHNTDPTYLAATGIFGATQTSFTMTGEPPRTTTGFAYGLADSLVTATAGLPGLQTADLVSFIQNTRTYQEIITTYGTTSPSGSGWGGTIFRDVLAPTPDHDGLRVWVYSSGIVASDTTIAAEITADSLKDATGNASLVTIKSNTSTRGEAAVTLSRPDSAAYGMDYAGFGFWALEEPSGAATAGAFIYGTPTTATETLPTTGTATYRGRTLATAFDSRDLMQQGKAVYGTIAGDSRLDVDFAKSSVQLTLDNLNMHLRNDGSTHKLPALSGSGTIGDEGFSGEFSGEAASPYYNRFIGDFYGPNSPLPPEVAGAWEHALPNPLDTSRNLHVQGVFIGKR